MSATYRIAATGPEQVTPDAYADSDTTGAALEFAVTKGPGDTAQPATWTTGTWDATAGGWRLWLRFTTASEPPVLAGPIIDVY